MYFSSFLISLYFDSLCFLLKNPKLSPSTENDVTEEEDIDGCFVQFFVAGYGFGDYNLSPVGIATIGVSVVSSISKMSISISSIEKIGLSISRTLAIVSISVGIRVSEISGISKMSISSIEKVRISISLGLSISRTLAIVSYMSIGVSIVSSISKVSQAISISSIQKVGVSI